MSKNIVYIKELKLPVLVPSYSIDKTFPKALPDPLCHLRFHKIGNVLIIRFLPGILNVFRKRSFFNFFGKQVFMYFYNFPHGDFRMSTNCLKTLCLFAWLLLLNQAKNAGNDMLGNAPRPKPRSFSRLHSCCFAPKVPINNTLSTLCNFLHGNFFFAADLKEQR